MTEQRRLAAILVADVVGYSKLVGRDEAGTLAELQKLRTDLIEPAITKHAGRLFKALRWAREGMLRPGYWGGWQWTRSGQIVASIQVRAEQDRVILTYRHRSGGGDWKDEQYPVLIERAISAARARGSFVLLEVVGGAWRPSMAATSLPAGTATGLPMRAREKTQVTARLGESTGSGPA
jgi:class 3 adenylate cyclase